MYDLNLKNYDTDVQFKSVIDAKGLEYPEAPKGGFEPTAVEAYTHPEYMVPATEMVVPVMFMGEEPVAATVVEEDVPVDEDVPVNEDVPADGE